MIRFSASLELRRAELQVKALQFDLFKFPKARERIEATIAERERYIATLRKTIASGKDLGARVI